MDDSKMPRIRRKEDLPDVMTMPLVAKALGCSLTVAYRLLKRDDFPHIIARAKDMIHSPFLHGFGFGLIPTQSQIFAPAQQMVIGA